MRILGLDFGDRVIGVAVSDETGSFARGLVSMPKKTWERDLPALIRENQVNLVVVGFPRSMDNRDNRQTAKVMEFMEKVRELTGCTVTRWDERLTSRLAERYLLAADLSRARRKKVVDRLAAQILLQDYLDYTRRGIPLTREAEEI